MDETCFICTEPMVWQAFGECNHPICHTCSLRLRALYKKNECQYCKTELKTVVITSKKDTQYSEYDIKSLSGDKKLQIFFDSKETQQQVLQVLKFNCPDPGCDHVSAGGWQELRAHTLKEHNETGDGKAFKGHPPCEFCGTLFYGNDELYEHCNKQHEQCFLCQRNGVRHQYYINYEALEKHFLKLQEHSSGKQKSKGIPIAIDIEYAGTRFPRRRQPSQQEPEEIPDQFREERRFQAPAGFGSQLSNAPPPVTRDPSPPPVARPEPTPAELLAMTDTEPLLNGDPEVVRGIERLLSNSRERILRFKQLMNQFKQNDIEAYTLLDAFIRMSLDGRPAGQHDQTLLDLGKVWQRMADTVPETSNMEPVIQEALLTKKKKKKGLSLQEFEALRKGTPKRDSMIQVWNAFKTKRKQEQDQKKRTNSFSNVAELSTTTARVLKIVDKPVKQARKPKMPQSGYVSMRPSSSGSLDNVSLPAQSAPSLSQLVQKPVVQTDFPELPTSSRPSSVYRIPSESSDPGLWVPPEEEPVLQTRKKKGKQVLMRFG
ncbi:hypothetical protein EDD86DRAFT_209613 [Gorgonomyces haynaldii]|nr:hypothetical protein EDD86DRAFT_209613 [Gorgonomyces haynaldii]